MMCNPDAEPYRMPVYNAPRSLPLSLSAPTFPLTLVEIM